MTTSPHDALFKAVFRQPEHAAAELRHILPASVVQEIEWSTLALRSSEHVGAELELFEFSPAWAPFIPHFSYAIDDLALTTDDELLHRPLGALPRTALWLMRNVRSPRAVLEHLPQWHEPLTEVLRGTQGPHRFTSLLRYVSLVMEELQFDEFRDTLVHLIPSSEPYVMTIAQQLEAKGRVEGRVEGLRAALLVVLESRSFPISDEHRAHIEACNDPSVLDQWLRAAVTVDSLDALFHDNS